MAAQPTIAAVREHRRRQWLITAGRRRYVRMADGGRMPAGIYWSVFWYFDVGPAWKQGRQDGLGKPSAAGKRRRRD